MLTILKIKISSLIKSIAIILFYTVLNLYPHISISSIPEPNERCQDVNIEAIYLHLNKSVYVPGEQIWFKGYIYDLDSRLPSTQTNNCFVQLFDEIGNEVYNGIFFVREGNFRGNIKIDLTLKEGRYSLRASTSGMKNFKDDLSYVTDIQVLTSDRTKETIALQDQPEMELVPDQGRITTGIKNGVAVKVSDVQGSVMTFLKGELLDESGKQVTSFKPNEKGIGRFEFVPMKGKKYRAVVHLVNGDKLTGEISPVGGAVGMSINNILEECIIIEISIINKKHTNSTYVLEVSNGLDSKRIQIGMNPGTRKKQFSISRKDIFPGFNNVTLTQNGKTVLERILFNKHNLKLGQEPKVSFVKRENDSLVFRVSMEKSEGIDYELSISVLPSITRAVHHKEDIFSALSLQPFLKERLYMGKGYFNGMDRKKLYNIDLALNAYGKAKKSLKLFLEKPESSYRKAFKLAGKVQGKNSKMASGIILHPTKMQGTMFIPTDENGNFSSNGILVEKGEKLKVTALDQKGKPMAMPLYMNLMIEKFDRRIVHKWIKLFEETKPNDETAPIKQPIHFKKLINKKVEILEEVVLKTEKKPEEETNSSTIQIPFFVKENSIKITKEMVRDFTTIADYILTNSKFTVVDNRPIGGGISINSRLPNSINFDSSVPVFIDDLQLIDLGILSTLTMGEVDTIYIDRIGHGLGLRGGSGGSIRIYTKKIPLDLTVEKSEYMEFAVDRGFENIQDYSNPGYSSFMSPTFLYYGTVDWKPSVTIKSSMDTYIKVPYTGAGELKFIIEGMGKNGNLVSADTTVEIKENF